MKKVLIVEDDPMLSEIYQKKFEKSGKFEVIQASSGVEAKEKAKVEEVDFEAIMVEFLADYSQLIGQLKPTDKIVVSTKKSDYVFVMTDEDESINATGGSGVSAELLKKDHNDYITGKISHDQLVAKIKVTKNDINIHITCDLAKFLLSNPDVVYDALCRETTPSNNNNAMIKNKSKLLIDCFFI